MSHNKQILQYNYKTTTIKIVNDEKLDIYTSLDKLTDVDKF